MTRAFDKRHVTIEDVLSTGGLLMARHLAAKDVRRHTLLAWFSETDMQGRNLWRLPEVRR